MFTGLIREIGTLRRVARAGGVTRFDIDAPKTAIAASPGDSIAINGICLTVTWRDARAFRVEAAAETRRVTTLPRWRAGDRVHLEPALRAGQALDGHLVLGHVDGQGRIAQIRRAGGSLFMTVTLPDELARFLMPKGSIAVDGVSLTVDAGPLRDRFTVNLIPFTLKWTHFGRARVGQAVNLEMDVLVKAARTGGGLRAALAAAPADDTGTPPRNAKSAATGRSLDSLFTRGWRRGRKESS